MKEQYNQTYIKRLSREIRKHYQAFDEKAFLRAVFDTQWQSRELKARMQHISSQLHRFLPENYQQSCNILIAIAPDFCGYHGMFIPDFVEQYGLNDWTFSLNVLESVTEHTSAEFAIRQFIIQDEQSAMAQVMKWASHDNHHVRRLASEGCRPRLPWACALPSFKQDPRAIVPVLNTLKSDPSLYVRRSVANNLNDISKDHPHMVLDLIRLWKGQHPDSDWVLKHGARTLLKQGDKSALHLFGLGTPKHINITGFTSSKTVEIGDRLAFGFTLESDKTLGQLRIEYRIDFVRASGSHGKKIFMLSQNTFEENKKTFQKTHPIKQLSTRKYHPGKYQLTIIVNGIPLKTSSFNVRAKREE